MESTHKINHARRRVLAALFGAVFIAAPPLAYSAMPKGAKRFGGTNAKGKGSRYTRKAKK